MKLSDYALITLASALGLTSLQAQVTNGFKNGTGFVSATVTLSDLTSSPPSADFSQVTTSGAFSDTSGVSGTFAWTVKAWSAFDTSLFTGTASSVAQSATGWGVTNGNANIQGLLGEAITFTFDLSNLTLGSEPLKLKGFLFGALTDGSEIYNIHRFAGSSSSLVASGTTSVAHMDLTISDGDIFSVSTPDSIRILNMKLDIGVVPEPTTGVLSALGLALISLLHRKIQ